MMTQRIKVYAALAAVVWFTYLLYALYPRQTPALIVHSNFKYILLWTPRNSPFNLIDEGLSTFINNNCEFINCYVTDNKYFLHDLTRFDAIAFSGKDLTKSISLPIRRSADQKYIFVATESPHYYPICNSLYESYFNWTFTYKVDSDIRWGYITIYDLENRVVGPKKGMQWPELLPVSDELKKKLSGKSKGAVWFVSNCNTPGKREAFYRKLLKLLPSYKWTIDVYGECGTLRCSRSSDLRCTKMVEEHYHFYFSFENSLSEDYVTEKLLTALTHYAIPVVYGGANYSRFLPPGSYLNARELGPEKLLETMNEIYNNKEKFYDFFRWRNHYNYKYSLGTDLCNLCAALNNEEMVHKHSVHSDLRTWWNDGKCRSYD